MKSAHCFPKMSLGTYTIVQKIVNSLTNVLLFFLGKNESICRKKNVKTIFVFQRVENSVVKGGNACVEKGFNVQYSVILVNLTLKMGSY